MLFNRQLFTLLITIVHPFEYKDPNFKLLRSNLQIIIDNLATAEFISKSLSRYGMQTIDTMILFMIISISIYLNV